MADTVKSFEESAGGVFGDILTARRVRRQAKVGLMTCGYFEYWRMYPETLKSGVEEDMRVVESRFKKDFGDCVVCSGIVDTLDAADEAGRRFRAEGIDALVIVEGTYLPDFISLHAVNHVRDVPVLFFSTQMGGSIDRLGDYEHSLRNSGLIGLAQLTGTFRKMGRPYRAVVGSIDDDRAYGRIRAFVQAVQAVLDIREANIGVIGHVFRGMYDLELSKTFLKGKFDVNIIYIQSSHLLEQWNAVTMGETDAEADKLMSRFRLKNVTADDVRRAVRLAVAMKKLAAQFGLDAMCFLDQHYVQRQVLTTARIGASLLMEQTGMAVTCEGDLGGLVMMMLMRSISGVAALMGEWGEYDEPENSCLIMGHGIGTPELARSDADVTLARTPEEWGFTGAGLNYELIVKPGPATIGHFIEAPGGYKMVLSPVQSIPFPKLNYDELHAVVRVKKPVREYLEELLQSGVSHHCILGLGDMSAAFMDVAWLMGLELFYIE